jgi:hypothetical protein
MRIVRVIIIGLLCIGFSTSALGAVTINEIAWMGDSASPNYEWIELYNSGETVSLDGWTLTDGNNLTIALAGNLAASTYAVLARNRADGTYPIASPFLIYTGALVNTGATLTLKRADGSTEDQVAGGEDWSTVGGDNESKETAQLTPQGWRTGPSTRGEANITNGSMPGVPVNPSSSGSTAGSNKTGQSVTVRPVETVVLQIPNTVLSLTPTVQTTAYVNQQIPFTVTSSGIGETWIDSLTYTWNFGDLSTSSQKSPTHTYRHAGTYVATVEAVYKRHRQVAAVEITILPVTLSLAKGVGGELLMHNNAPYEIDVSGYQLVGAQEMIFPPHSIIAPKSTLTIPVTHFPQYYGRIWLRDKQAGVVATWPSDKSSDTVPATIEKASSVRPLGVSSVTPNTLISPSPPAATTTLITTDNMENSLPPYVATALTGISANTTSSPSPLRLLWPYLTLAGLLMAVIGSLLVTGTKSGSISAKITSES